MFQIKYLEELGTPFSPFSPLDLSPVLWLDASDTATITAADGAWLDGTGLQLPGTNGNYAWTPDSAALSIAADMEIVVRVKATDWTPSTTQAFVSKWTGGLTTRSYALQVGTSGQLLFSLCDGVTNFSAGSTLVLPVVDGTAYWLKGTYVKDTGAGQYAVEFFYAADSVSEPSVWTKLGSTVTGASIGDLRDSTTALLVGGIYGGTSSSFAGTVYRAVVRDGVGGTAVFDADFAAEAEGTLSFSEDSANAATVSLVTTYGAVSQWDDKSGNGNHATQGTAALQPTSGTRTLSGKNVLDFASDSIATASSAFSSTSQHVIFVVAQADSTANMYLLDSTSGGRNIVGVSSSQYLITAGTNQFGGTPDTSSHIFRATFDATDTLHIDGSSIISGNAGATAIDSLRLGSNQGATTVFWDGIIAEMIFVSGTLTAGEIAATESYLADKWGITL